ncbi:MAG: alpha/beta hydrolase [Lachnospiraceae bacterium]|nr:alpha/beta hydrolase [Lachnospiraceae bacterium]
MVERIKIEPDEDVILLTTDVVYGYRTEFCGAQYLPLKLSLMRPRIHFSYDEKKTVPALLFLCGGGWSETDHNAWLPELSWFGKRGYAVVSVQYPVTAATRFPESLEAVKKAVSYLKANGEALHIDMGHPVVMGESAGAYLALLYAAREGAAGAVAFYPPVSPTALVDQETGECVLELPCGADRFPSLLGEIGEGMPPVMILHGTADSLVPYSHGERIYERILEAGGRAELLLIEGADHAERNFFQEAVKERILRFLNR